MQQRSPNHLALGEAVRRRRLEIGLSQEELGLESGIHRTYVGGVERGERNISLANLMRLASVLQTRPSSLLSVAERDPAWRDEIQ